MQVGSNFNRRRSLATILAAAISIVCSVGGAFAKRLTPTPSQTSGPFYPERPPAEVDADLASFAGGQASGIVLHLTGRVIDEHGEPVRLAIVEIWQCDTNGIYRHPRDKQTGLDPHFQGFGRARTDKAGHFRFRTIRPVPYGSRTPHIHIAVLTPGHDDLVSQLYFDGDPDNEDDFLFRRLTRDERDRVTLFPIDDSKNEAGSQRAVIDIVLGV